MKILVGFLGRLAIGLWLAAWLSVVPAVAQETLPEEVAGEGLSLVEEEDAGELFDAGAEDGSPPGPPAPDRIVFDVPFPQDRGGGFAKGSAGTVDYLGEHQIVAAGAVEFSYQNTKLLAERVEVDLEKKTVVAEGNVILDEGPSRITGTRLEYDLETRTGTVFDAEGFVDPDMFLTGSEIRKEGEHVYTITDGVLTACSEDLTPDWSFKLGRGRVNMEGWAKVHNTTMRVKKLPVLYLPYLIFPARQDRTSGFLFPNIGYSSERGQHLGLAWYQTLGRSYDATFYADLYGRDYYGFGGEFRYRPSHGTGGTIQAQLIDDPTDLLSDGTPAGTRWKATVNHTSEDLPWGLRGVIRYIDFSDFEFFRDFERDFNNISIRTLWSSAFLAGSWGSHSLNLLVDDRETFIRRGVTVNQRQLPEIEYRLRPTQIGDLPLYLELLSSVNLFEVSRTDLLKETYHRADLAPRLTVPISPAPWLSVSLAAAARATSYGNSLTPDGTAFSGESLTRTFPSASAQIIGPSFSRIFDAKIGRFGKFKHIIEPRFAYLFIDEFEDQELVPLFDEVDTLLDQELFSVSLVNRLLAKPADEESLEGAREIMSLEIGQSFSQRDDRPLQLSSGGTLETRDGPIAARLRFNPSLYTNFELRTQYNTLFSKIESASLLGGTRFGDHSVGLSWVARINPEFEQTTSHQARLYTDLALVRNRLRLGSQINFDLQLNFLQMQRHVVTYTSQCYGLRFEWRELARILSTGAEDTTSEYRVSISLKNIGTFLDLNGGDTNGFRP